MTPGPPFVRELHLDDVGSDVLAVARALRKWAVGRSISVKSLAMTDEMGPAKVQLVGHFQQVEGLHVDRVYGPLTHAKLAALGFFDADGVRLLTEEHAALVAASQPRTEFVTTAELTVQHSSLFRYTEALGDGPGERGYWRVAPLRWDGSIVYSCDCSQHFIGVGHHAGLKHPIFTGDGATGEILKLKPITFAVAQPGDPVVFVGPDHPAGVHVTILHKRVGSDWQVVNMGGPGDPSYGMLSAEADWHARYADAPYSVVLQLPTP